MSEFKGRGANRLKKRKASVGKQSKEVVESMDKDNPIMQMFQKFSAQLDDRNDRYERVFKLNRDITIESKRIIFLLHTSDTDLQSKKEPILEEAYKRLSHLWTHNFKNIALELMGHDSYFYHRAFTCALQEFIEALCFYQYIKNSEMNSWEHINNNFQYKDDNSEYSLLFTPYDFIMGIADFTGELMRKCINILGVGNVNECFKLCNFVRNINTGFLGLSFAGNKDLSRKAYVLRQSLSKMELVCYNIKIRGSEVPKHMLISVMETKDIDNDIDEGFSI